MGTDTFMVERSDGALAEEQRNSLTIRVPSGRNFREIVFLDGSSLLTEALDSTMERWRFVDGYQAIWSSELATIECELAFGPTRQVLRRVARALGQLTDESTDPPSIQYPSEPSGPQVTLGPASSEYSVLAGRRPTAFRRSVIRIATDRLDTHESARDLLERVGNAILFQIDLATDAPLYLAEERSDNLVRRRRITDPTFSPPAYDYDKEPMSLYWYGRTAVGMPLLQFLALYQVLEFYFPIYSQRDAQQVIRDRLKDPRFNPQRDADVNNLLMSIKAAVSGRGFGEERAQLRATILACVTADEMRSFFEEDDTRKEFFATKQADLIVADQRIPLHSSASDVRAEVADRIYEIRCRIVHTKSGGDGDQALMLPFSREARGLGYDLELISFLAREVLIAASRPLRA